MAGLAIQSPGVAAAENTTGKLYPPNCEGLAGLFILGGTLADSVKNRSPVTGAVDATAVGSPVVNATSLTLTNLTAFLQTQIAEADEMTLVAAFTTGYLAFNAITNTWTPRQGTPGTNSHGVGLRSYGGSAPETGRNYAASMGHFDGNNGGASTQMNAGGAAVVGGSLMAAAARFTTTTATRNILTTGGAALTATIPNGQQRDRATGLIRLGSANVGGSNDAFAMTAAAIFTRRLSDDELAAFYAWLKAYEANRGNVI